MLAIFAMRIYHPLALVDFPWFAACTETAGETLPTRKVSNMTRKWTYVVLVAWLANAAVANARDEAMRGELLYSTYCIACHNKNIHWRDNKLANDWGSLKEQVRHWQKVARLEWSDEDITLVARHLNSLHYHYPEPAHKSEPDSNPSRMISHKPFVFQCIAPFSHLFGVC